MICLQQQDILFGPKLLQSYDGQGSRPACQLGFRHETANLRSVVPGIFAGRDHLPGSLIPIANFALPAVSASTRNRADVELIEESISAQENPGISTVYGLILYPFDIDGSLTFDFLTPQTSTSYTIIRNPEFKMNLIGGEDAFITLCDDDNGDSQLESIYLQQDAKLSLIWNFQP